MDFWGQSRQPAVGEGNSLTSLVPGAEEFFFNSPGRAGSAGADGVVVARRLSAALGSFRWPPVTGRSLPQEIVPAADCALPGIQPD